MKPIIAAIISSAVVLGCAHTEATKAPVEIGAKLDERAYADLVGKNTQHSVQYEGFYNKFEIYATFLNSETQTAILQKKSEVFLWDQKQAQTEREKVFQENSNQTKFAISFFTPSIKLNDLAKGNSIWKIYLEAGGQRYEGKATKSSSKLEDVRALFPTHNRWSTAYEIVFKVPLSAIEKSPVTFIITSTQGSASLKF